MVMASFDLRSVSEWSCAWSEEGHSVMFGFLGFASE